MHQQSQAGYSRMLCRKTNPEGQPGCLWEYLDRLAQGNSRFMSQDILGNLSVSWNENAVIKVCGKDWRGLQDPQAEEPTRGLWGRSQHKIWKGLNTVVSVQIRRGNRHQCVWRNKLSYGVQVLRCEGVQCGWARKQYSNWKRRKSAWFVAEGRCKNRGWTLKYSICLSQLPAHTSPPMKHLQDMSKHTKSSRGSEGWPSEKRFPTQHGSERGAPRGDQALKMVECWAGGLLMWAVRA